MNFTNITFSMQQSMILLQVNTKERDLLLFCSLELQSIDYLHNTTCWLVYSATDFEENKSSLNDEQFQPATIVHCYV
jgi:hypothetical protein